MKSIFLFSALLIAGSLALTSGGIARPGSALAAYPGADNIGVTSQQCLPDGTLGVTFAWTTYNTGSQWVDLSAANNGFVLGTYTTAGPLPYNQNSLTWSELQPSTLYTVRINTLTDYGWFSSSTAAFYTGAACQQAPVEPPWDIPFTPPGASAS